MNGAEPQWETIIRIGIHSTGVVIRYTGLGMNNPCLYLN